MMKASLKVCMSLSAAFILWLCVSTSFNLHCCFMRNGLMCLVAWLSMMFILGLNPCEVRPSNYIFKHWKAYVIKVSNRRGQNCIYFLMVQYKKANGAIQQDEWEWTHQIIVHHPFFICKRPKTESICNRFIVIQPNKVGTLLCAIRWPLIRWGLLKEWQNRWQENRDNGDGCHENLRGLGGCAAQTMAWPLHVPLGSGRAWVEVLQFQILVDIWEPIINPCLVALSSVGIFGLHNNWWANLTVFACVMSALNVWMQGFGVVHMPAGLYVVHPLFPPCEACPLRHWAVTSISQWRGFWYILI